jgi:DNA-binding NarL/FixJ family response regulator
MHTGMPTGSTTDWQEFGQVRLERMVQAIVVLSSDLMWLSRFQAVGQAVGVEVRGARNPAQAQEALKSSGATCLVLDLDYGRASDVLATLRQSLPAEGRVVAFGSHVDTATLIDARAAGCDPVWPRSLMAERLSAMLPVWAGAATAP